MNFSAVRGFNAYAQFTAKVRDAVSQRTVDKVQEPVREQPSEKNQVRFEYNEPVDIVSISSAARIASAALQAAKENPRTELKEWMRENGVMRGQVKVRDFGIKIEELLSKSGIDIEEGEKFDITMDVWCAVSVTGRSTEKAKAIQDLLNSTGNGINWGLLLQQLPPQ